MEHQPNREGATATATSDLPPCGQPRILASYKTERATRRVVRQRIKGTVALIDISAGDDGNVYLIERHVPCKEELDAIVADYTALAAELGRPPAQTDWRLCGVGPGVAGRDWADRG